MKNARRTDRTTLEVVRRGFSDILDYRRRFDRRRNSLDVIFDIQ